MRKLHVVKPGSKLRLDEIDAAATPGWKHGKEKTLAELERLSRRMHDLQNLLWAEHKHMVLVVLQGMDTSGKDGTISHVFGGVNPMGVRVAQFKQPTPQELDHDFLWRVHAQVPGRGEIAIFNRSHYEDVLVVRVHELAPPEVWRPRFHQINDFEHILTENGTTILKFFLHIDRDEQRRRLQERLDDPAKRWKFQMSDLIDRKLWDSYMKAYEDAIRKTCSKEAPWYVVPANKKWYRNLVVATVLVETLEALGPQPPEAKEKYKGLVIDD
jgi:PPK2 family polyphosphate:nucleotide phosphotransferase